MVRASPSCAWRTLLSSKQFFQAIQRCVGVARGENVGIDFFEGVQCLMAISGCEQRQLLLRFGRVRRVVFQFANFPLTSVHVNAFSAARASEAAGLQGKFWEMHDALYNSTNWKIWTVAADPSVQYNAYATQLGLNLAQFKTDFASSKVNDSITADMSAGTKLNVQGTPTYFLNGVETKINPTLADFEKVLNAALAK